MGHRRGALALVVATALVLPACSDDDGTVERAEATTTTADAETTTTEAPTTTTTTLGPCEPLPQPVGDAQVTEAVADVDGDGEDDVLRSQSTGGEDWRLEVELARGGGAAVDLVAFGGNVGVVGGADVDGDGTDEIWARTGSGASTTIVGLFVLDGCELAQATFVSGEPADLPVGGSVGTASGLECTDDPPPAGEPAGDLVTFTASYVGDGTGGEAYEVEAVAFDLDGSVLQEGDRTTTETEATDPAFLRYTSFACHDLIM